MAARLDKVCTHVNRDNRSANHHRSYTGSTTAMKNAAQTTNRLNAALTVLTALLIWGLHAGAADITWNTGDGDWDTTSADWTGAAVTYTDGSQDNVFFEDTVGSGGTVTITDVGGSGGVTPLSTTVDGALDYTFSGNAILGGPLNKSGDGTLNLTNASNSFSSIELSGGVLRFSDPNQIGSGAISFAGDATLNYDPPGGPSNLVNDIAIADGSTATLYPEHSGTPAWELTGRISGGSALNPVTIVLVEDPAPAGTFQRFAFTNSDNDYVGTLRLENRALLDYNDNDAAYGAPGSSISAAGPQPQINLNGYTLLRDLDGGTASLVVVNGTLAGVATGNIYASGTLTLTNPGNNVAFLGIANGPTVVVSEPGNIGGTAGSLVNLGNNGTLRIDGTPTGDFAATLRVETTGSPQLKGTIDVSNPAADINWTGPLTTRQTDSDILVKSGPGTLNFSDFAVTAFTGTLIIEVDEGRLNLNDSTVVPGTFDDVTVAGGATLGGTGTIDLAAGRSVTVNAGGTLNPGTSVGTLTVSGDVTFDSGAVFAVELEDVAAGLYDRLAVTDGAITLAAGSELVLTPGLFSASLYDTAYILDNQTGNPIGGTFQYGEGDIVGIFGGRPWMITYQAIADVSAFGGNGIALVAVPEPATATLVLLLASGSALMRRRPRVQG